MFLIGARILSGTLSAESGRKGLCAPRRRHHPRSARRGRGPVRAGAWPREGTEDGPARARQARRRRDDGRSDLDLILVYDFDEEHPESDGERPLYGGQYFARLTQRLISALTARTNYGALYQVDMRLRPSGRSGPVATQIGAFRDYQQSEAWTWEHMALTRARVVSATDGFEPEVEAVIRDVLCRPRDRDAIAADALEMRRAIAQEKRRERPLGPEICRRRTDRYRIHRAISAARACRGESRDPRSLDGAVARKSGARSESCRRRIPRYCVRRRSSITNLSQILRLCLPGPFDPENGRRRIAASCSPARRTCRISRPARRASDRDAEARAAKLLEDAGHPIQRLIAAGALQQRLARRFP